MKHQILNQNGYKISTGNPKEKVEAGNSALTCKEKSTCLSLGILHYLLLEFIDHHHCPRTISLLTIF